MRANAKVQPDAERNLIVKEKALSVKTRNDADSGRIAANEMRCDGIGWSNDVETDYGRVQIFMTENILGFDTFRILRLWPSILIRVVTCGREIK
jgi:hypothetical protein